jgi:hypothetical protein
MSHFAYVENGIVTKVLVIEQDVINTGLFGNPGNWVQTSYNTFGGVHRLGGTPLRKNYAGIGFVYDSVRDAFYAPQPSPEWTLDEETCTWIAPAEMLIETDDTEETTTETTGTTTTSPYPSWTWDEASQQWVAPIPMPDDGNTYTWNEDTQQWVSDTV